jgi:transcriptional regulator with XRE-family HTH domain
MTRGTICDTANAMRPLSTPAMDQGPLLAGSLRHGLRRWRVLHRVKQAHAAEMLGVAQSTVSRWENGTLLFEAAEARKIEALVAARLTSSGDAALRQLIEESPRAIHLVCDVSHRLLGCSASRRASFGAPESALLGRSLWRYSTAELMAQEACLDTLGWHDLPVPPVVEFEAGDNGSQLVPIRPGTCRWTRLTLSGGTCVRLVETLGSA